MHLFHFLYAPQLEADGGPPLPEQTWITPGGLCVPCPTSLPSLSGPWNVW